MTPEPKRKSRYDADENDFDEYDAIGMDGLLAATEKVLAVNRGLVEPDDRDSLDNDRIYTPDQLLSEHVKLDTNRVLRNTMGRLNRTRTLQGFPLDAFGDYTKNYITSNPLVPALEEVNPMHLMEHKRRMTKLGPGGVGDPNAITLEMQGVHSSQFGFIDPLAGPECLPEDSEVYTRRGWVKWNDVSDTDQFACRIDDRFAWGAASRIVRQPYAGELIVAKSSTLLMKATPNHRVMFKRDAATKNFSVGFAAEVFGKPIRIPRRHLPQAGDDGMATFTLPEIGGTNGNQKRFAPFDIVDWCAYMGWWLSEGNSHVTAPGRLAYATGRVCITQCRVANPENYAEIRALCLRMGICDCDNGRTFISGAKQLVSYFSQWQHGCYDKWIPSELFHAPLKARQALLDALIKGDGRSPRNRLCYCTVSRRLAESVERLAIELGYAAYIREEKDNRPHVTTTNYVVSLVRSELATLQHKAYIKKQNGTTTGNNWSTEYYDGVVCCATVPGGFLYVRGASNHPGYWTGNSEKAGVDVRLAYGTRIGSNGRVYQKFRNRKTGKMEWLDSAAVRDKVVRLPD
jgi:hypothetical protein